MKTSILNGVHNPRQCSKTANHQFLHAVPQIAPEYAEAQRLIKLLMFFKSIPEVSLPGTSILREFLGGSKFTY